MLLVSEVSLQIQDYEVLDIPIVHPKLDDGMEEEPEEESEEEKELKELKKQEYEHLHQGLVELIGQFMDAGFFKRVLIHCVQAIPHTTTSSKKRVYVNASSDV